MILHRNEKSFLFSSVYKHLKGRSAYITSEKGTWLKKISNAYAAFFQKKTALRINEEICCIIDKQKVKMTMNGWKNDGSDILRALSNVYKK